MRLRILDLNTPWFWLTLFFNRPSYGKPKLELSLWGPHKWRNWWLHVWKWEQIGYERGGYAQETSQKQNVVG